MKAEFEFDSAGSGSVGIIITTTNVAEEAALKLFHSSCQGLKTIVVFSEDIKKVSIIKDAYLSVPVLAKVGFDILTEGDSTPIEIQAVLDTFSEPGPDDTKTILRKRTIGSNIYWVAGHGVFYLFKQINGETGATVLGYVQRLSELKSYLN